MKISGRVWLALAAISPVFHCGCGSDQSPLSPQQALKSFRLPPGFRIELVAAEPQVVSPVAMAFDARGRLFVVEMPDYPLKSEFKGRIKMLEDLDGDGRFERSRVFADNLHFPNGVMAWRDGILVTCAPDILYLADTDGDGKADVRKVMLTGFAATNPQLRVNGLAYGLDNWIYAAYPRVSMPSRYVKEFGDQGRPITFPDHPQIPGLPVHGTDIRFRLEPPKVEAIAGNSEFGNTFDAWGGRFTVWNNDHVRYVVLPNESVSRNAYQSIAEASDSISDHERASRVFGITKHMEYIHDSELGRFTSACGISVYTAGRFPAEYQGNFFVCEPASNLVHRDVLAPAGPTLVAKRAQNGVEFLASTDGWFRPVFSTVGPDGALYIVDFYRPVIEHPEWIPPEMMKDLDLYSGAERGRIYRVAPDSSKPGPKPQLDRASVSELVTQFSNPNLWWRITAQRLLLDRRDPSAAPALQALARQGPSQLGRIHALWTLDGLGSLDAALVLEALGDPDPRIREQAVRLARRRLGDPRVREKLLHMIDEPDDRVELQLASLLGEFPAEQAFQALERIALRHMEQPWFRTVVLSSAAGNGNRWYKAMTGRNDFIRSASKGKQDFLNQLASIVGARQKEPEIAELLAMVSRGCAENGGWWQAATLDGLAKGIRRGSAGLVKLPEAQHRVMDFLGCRAPEVRKAALSVAVRLDLTPSPELRSVVQKASLVAQDEAAKPDERIMAIGMLGLDPGSATAPLLEKLLTPQQPEPVQVAASEALCSLRDPHLTAILLDKWKSYTGPVREAVLKTFFSDRRRLPALLDAIRENKVQPWALSAGRRSQLLRSPDPEIRKRAEVLFANAFEDRKAVYDRYRASLHMTGDPKRGQRIFQDNCSECHKIGNVGSEVGPDLLGVVNRHKEALLNDILIPNQNIEDGYEEYLVETRDGRMINGVIAKQTPTSITLRRAKGEEDTVPRNAIASVRSLNLSPMPEDPEKKINVEQMADLLAYLKSLR